jgi:hypothetical protein
LQRELTTSYVVLQVTAPWGWKLQLMLINLFNYVINFKIIHDIFLFDKNNSYP